MKPDAIVQAWRNTLEKLVNSQWKKRTQDQRLYDKMLWEPILKIFQVFGSDFPISDNYRNKLGDFINSCTRVDKYPAGDFFKQKGSRAFEQHQEVQWLLVFEFLNCVSVELLNCTVGCDC